MLGYFTMPLQFMRFAFDSLVDVQRQRTNVPLNPESDPRRMSDHGVS